MANIHSCFRYLPILVAALVGCASAPGSAGASAQAARSPSKEEPPAPAAPSVLVTEALGSPHIGEQAPDFELVDQSGARVHLADLRGSVVVLAFVASFCPFSAAAQPNLARLAEHYAPAGVHVLAVDVGENEQSFNAYVTRMRLPFPVLRDPDAAVSLRFTPTNANPGVKDRTQVIVTSNLVIDRQGRIRFFTLLDTVHFDAKLVHVSRAVDLALQAG